MRVASITYETFFPCLHGILKPTLALTLNLSLAPHPPPHDDPRTILWEDIGVVRRPSGLLEGANLLSSLAERCGHLYETSALSAETVELRNGAQTGAMIAAAAANNPCSVGTHYIEEEEEDEAEGQAQG